MEGQLLSKKPAKRRGSLLSKISIISWFNGSTPWLKAAVICVPVLCAGLLFLYCYTLFTAELPQGSKVSSMSQPPNDKNQALHSSLDELEEQTGAGAGTAEADSSNLPLPAPVSESGTTQFISLSSAEEYFAVKGTITNVARYANVREAPLEISETGQNITRIRFTKPGFYGLTVREAGREQHYSVFVSPVPTVHADAAGSGFNWYRTQHNTVTTSNCGPASVSMGIGWSTGKDLPVADVRRAIGWQGEGGTSFEELIVVLKSHGVPASVAPLRNIGHIREVIDSGGIAIILFLTDGVRSVKGDPANDLFGKYYNDSVGHYIVIKGYSLNNEYLVIYDPIPSDWGANSFRYGDEESMIGRNRYYATAELLGSLRRNEMIVVPKIAR